MALPYLTAGEILALDDLTTEEVEVPEWGCTVRVRTMRAIERERFDMWLAENRIEATDRRAYPTLVALTAIDERGEPLFARESIEALAQKNGAAVQRVFAASMHLSGLSGEAQEDLEKNSEAEPSADSPLG